MPETQRTFAMIKPDAFRRGLTGEILSRFQRRGLELRALQLLEVTREQAQRHYAEHEGKPFYEDLVEFITSGPVVAMVLEGPDAVSMVRTMMGATNPLQAAPGTIRGDYALEIDQNIVHGADSPESARREIGIYFAGAGLA